MKKSKIVLDTNLVIAANFAKKSYSAQILDLAKEGKVEIFSSPALDSEMKKILQNVKADEKYKGFIASIVAKRHIVRPKIKLNIIKDDPQDNKLLEVAKTCKADYIISNDRHLLELKKFGEIKIINSKEFITIFTK